MFCGPTVKIVFNALLLFLPAVAACAALDSAPRDTQTLDSAPRDTQTLDSAPRDTPTLSSPRFCNVFDPQLGAHLCDSNISGKDLELSSLLEAFRVQTEASSAGHAGSHGSVGRATHCLRAAGAELRGVCGLYRLVRRRLQETGSLAVFTGVEMPLTQTLAEMEIRGVSARGDRDECGSE